MKREFLVLVQQRFCGFVFEEASDGGVIEGHGCGGVGTGGDEECGIGRVGFGVE